MQGHEESVVEGEILGIGQVEAALDPLLEHGARERLVHVEGVAIAVELAGDGGPDVDGESGNGREEEALDVIAGDHADDVGTRGLEELLDLAIGGVNAEDHVAVLGLGPDEELRGVRAGERGDQRHDPMLGHARRPAQVRGRLRDLCARRSPAVHLLSKACHVCIASSRNHLPQEGQGSCYAIPGRL